jgi:hypothetical protein
VKKIRVTGFVRLGCFGCLAPPNGQPGGHSFAATIPGCIISRSERKGATTLHCRTAAIVARNKKLHNE